MRKENLNIPAALCIFMMILACRVWAVTHYVSPGQSIQAAIDAASNGDEIEVASGTYYEAIDFKGKAVRLYSSGGPEVTTIDAGMRVLLSEDFNDGDYAGWDICDEGNIDGPSVWSAATGEMVQSSNIHTTPVSDPDMLGTFAWWQAGMWWSNYEATLRIRSSDDDGIGVMFRYQDPNNYYRFTWLRQDHAQGVGRRRLVRCKDGQFNVLDADDIVYVSEQEYQVTIIAYGTDLQIFIDETPVLSAVDSSFSRGSIALYCWGNRNTYFDNIWVQYSSAFHVVQCVSGEGNDTILEGFTITGGDAMGTDQYEGGGGMCNVGSSPTVTNCTFSGNSADYGGGMYNNWGSSPASPTVTNCTFSGNTAKLHGGGMFNNLHSNPTVVNCIFSGNSATGKTGGGMYNSISSPTVTNCIFSGNSATSYGGGMYNFYNSSPTVTNCILWGDTPNEIFNDGTSSSTVTYSDVEGGTGESWFGTGCIDADPLFVNAAGADLRLAFGSPCIDAGDSSVLLAVPVYFDLDGRDRYVDIDSIENTGFGLFEFLDMGVYEFHCSGIAGDINCDGVVDFKDVAILCGNWLARAGL